jgi:hypothetical protein
MIAEQPTSQRVGLGRRSAAAICGRYHEVAVGGSINYKRDFVGTGLHLRGRSRSQLGAASLLHQSSQHHAGTTRTYPSRVFKAEPGRADKPFRPSRARRARRTAVMLASGLNLTKPGGSPPQPRGNPELPRSPTVASPARWSAIEASPTGRVGSNPREQFCTNAPYLRAHN